MGNVLLIEWIGSVLGIFIGLAGGIVGTYFSIKNTNSPRERSFMIKVGIVCLAGVFIFLALLFLLPKSYRWFIWIPYAIVLALGISYGNKTQQKIREHESQQK
ncbi:MAG: hypothetical protein JXA96_14225 [Sedimentisphaerales bacterium]|nr:hypothetical protein [Sedimentisphaerales bacterium]